MTNFTGDSRANGTPKEQKITHIFFEDAGSVTVIRDDCFNRQNRYNAQTQNVALSLKYLELPTNLKYIGQDAFREQDQLEYFDLPEGLVKIGSNAFNHAFIEQKIERPIYVPGSVKEIGERAFAYLYTQTDKVQFGSQNYPSQLDLDFIQSNMVNGYESGSQGYANYTEWIFGNNPNALTGAVVDWTSCVMYRTTPLIDTAAKHEIETVRSMFLRHTQEDLLQIDIQVTG